MAPLIDLKKKIGVENPTTPIEGGEFTGNELKSNLDLISGGEFTGNKLKSGIKPPKDAL